MALAAVFGSIVLMALVALQAVLSYRRRFIVRTEERVESLFMAVPPERFWMVSLLGTAGGALILALVTGFSAVPIAAGAVFGFMAPGFYLSHMERRRRRKFNTQLLEAIPMIAGAMKAGMSLVQAMERVIREMDPPLRQEFAYALQENQVGKPLIQALQDMRGRIRSDDLDITVNAISIAQQTGGVLSELLLKIADTIRGRNRVRGKIEALSAQGRLQGLAMVFMPWLLVVLLFLVDPAMISPVFSTTIGQLTLVGIVILDFFGWIVIRRIVSIDV